MDIHPLPYFHPSHSNDPSDPNVVKITTELNNASLLLFEAGSYLSDKDSSPNEIAAATAAFNGARSDFDQAQLDFDNLKTGVVPKNTISNCQQLLTACYAVFHDGKSGSMSDCIAKGDGAQYRALADQWFGQLDTIVVALSQYGPPYSK